MSPPPKGKPTANTSSRASGRARAGDWTSAVVGVGLALLAVLGVVTVFSGPLLALVAPSTADDATPAEAERAPHAPPAAADGGAQATGGNGPGGHS